MRAWYLCVCLAIALLLGACRLPAAEAAPAATPVAAQPRQELVYLLGQEVYLWSEGGGQRIGELPPDAGRFSLGPRGLAYRDEQAIRILWLDGRADLARALGPREGLDILMNWSHDGSALAYAAAWNEQNGARSVELGVYDGERHHIVAALTNQDARLAPTPRLFPPSAPMPGFANLAVLGYDAVEGRLVTAPLGGDEPAALWVYATDSGERSQTVPLPQDAAALALSPDLRQLALPLPGALLVLPFGAFEEPLVLELPADTHAAWLSWSPDGRSLAYLLHAGAQPGLDASYALALEVWTIETGQVRRLATEMHTYAALIGWMGNGELLLETYDMQTGEIQVSRLDVRTGSAMPVDLPAGARLLGAVVQ